MTFGNFVLIAPGGNFHLVYLLVDPSGSTNFHFWKASCKQSTDASIDSPLLYFALKNLFHRLASDTHSPYTVMGQQKDFTSSISIVGV